MRLSTTFHCDCARRCWTHFSAGGALEGTSVREETAASVSGRLKRSPVDPLRLNMCVCIPSVYWIFAQGQFYVLVSRVTDPRNFELVRRWKLMGTLAICVWGGFVAILFPSIGWTTAVPSRGETKRLCSSRGDSGTTCSRTCALHFGTMVWM